MKVNENNLKKKKSYNINNFGQEFNKFEFWPKIDYSRKSVEICFYQKSIPTYLDKS